MKIFNRLLITLSILTAISCSTLGKFTYDAVLGATTGSDGISVDAQIGDREQQLDVGTTNGTGEINASDNAAVNVQNERNDASIENAEDVTVQNVPPWVFILAVLGWVAPTPQSMFSSLRKEISTIRGRK